MIDRKLTIILLAVLVSLIAIVVGWYLGLEPEPELPVEVEQPLEPVPEGTGVVVDLYFPGGGTRLRVEQREVPADPEPASRLNRLLQELTAGPESDELYSPLAEAMSIGWTHLDAENVAYVDLVYSGEASRPAWGSGQEMLSIYSIVNTVLLNIPEISGIVLLSNGQQRATFAGHVDTSRPLVANRDLIATVDS